MTYLTTFHKQRGVTLFVGLVLLVLITLMMTAAFKLSNTNLTLTKNYFIFLQILKLLNLNNILDLWALAHR